MRRCESGRSQPASVCHAPYSHQFPIRKTTKDRTLSERCRRQVHSWDSTNLDFQLAHTKSTSSWPTGLIRRRARRPSSSQPEEKFPGLKRNIYLFRSVLLNADILSMLGPTTHTTHVRDSVAGSVGVYGSRGESGCRPLFEGSPCRRPPAPGPAPAPAPRPTLTTSNPSVPASSEATMNAFPDPHTHRPTSFYIEDILLNKPKQLQYARAELTAAAAAAAAAGTLGPLGRPILPEYYTYFPAPTYLPHQHFTHPAFAAQHKPDHPFLLPTTAGQLTFISFVFILGL